MKKILIVILSLFIIWNVYANDLLKELMEKVNKQSIYWLNYKDFIDEDKLYLINNIRLAGFKDGFIRVEKNVENLEILNDKVVRTYNNVLTIYFPEKILSYTLIKYTVSKENNAYIINGETYMSPHIKQVVKFIFNKNSFLVIKDEDKKKPIFYYIDVNNDFEERYESQRESYLYSLVKDSKNNELELTEDNKLIYKHVTYNYKIKPLLTTDESDFYKDKFVLIFGEYEMPVEIVNNTLKIIKDKELKMIGPYYWIDLDVKRK